MLPPPILLKPNFLPDPDELFAQMQSVTWDERMRARKTASFGVAYNYSQITYEAQPMPATLMQICQQLNAELGFLPNNCLINFYPDGQSAMGFHSDSVLEMAANTGVAIISLGCQRDILYRRKDAPEQKFRYPLPSGSLLFMSAAMQQDWMHAIPKSEAQGARISLSFRLLNLETAIGQVRVGSLPAS